MQRTMKLYFTKTLLAGLSSGLMLTNAQAVRPLVTYTPQNASKVTIPQNGNAQVQLGNIGASPMSNENSIQTTELLLAGGSYYDGSTHFPMLAQSTNEGLKWSYRIEKNASLPVDFNGYGEFKNTSCFGSTCTAGGNYSDGTTVYPMLAQSTDGGLTWSYKIEKNVLLPVDYSGDGIFYSTSCSGNLCIAGGIYHDGSTHYPMLAQSTDGGLTWSYKIEKNTLLPVDYSGDGGFDSTSCSESTCTAVGSYYDGSVIYPMLAQSTDGGLTWSYKIEKNASLPAKNIFEGRFNSTSCAGTTCIAGGSYYEGSSEYPMLAQSTDGGLTWSYKIEKNTSLPVDYSDFGVFYSTSCSGNICTAGGSYSDGSINYPMLAKSTDGGLNWSYKIEKNTSLPMDYSGNGNFNSTSCSGNTCTASGSYSDGSNNYPMLAQSTDGGLTWSYKIEKNTLLPVDYSGDNGDSGFKSTSCSGSTCTAAGNYSDGKAADYPMLAQSTDGGLTWSYKIEKNTTLPLDFSTAGGFNNSSIKTSAYLSDPYSFFNRSLKKPRNNISSKK